MKGKNAICRTKINTLFPLFTFIAAFVLCNVALIGSGYSSDFGRADQETDIKASKSKYLLDYPKSLELLAHSYATAEYNYPKAVEVQLKAVEIVKEIAGIESDEYIHSLRTLSHYYNSMGEYGKSLPILEVIAKKKENDPYMASELAGLYIILGEYEKAMPLLSGLEKRVASTDGLGKGIDLAAIHKSLGDLFLATGEYKNAKRNYQKSIDVLKKGFPGINIEALGFFGAPKLFGQARACQYLGQHAEAEELYRKALAVEKSPIHALGLGDFYRVTCRYESSEQRIQESIQMYQDRRRVEHPENATALMQLGILYGDWQNKDKAFRAMIQSLDSTRKFVDMLSLWASEKRLQSYYRTVDERYDYFYSLISQYFRGTSESAKRALETHLYYKGHVIEVLSARNRLALLSRDPRLAREVNAYTGVVQRLSHLALNPPKNIDPTKCKEIFASLEKRKQKLEESLARGSAEFAVKQETAKVNIDEIAASLPENGIYIDFIEHNKYDYKTHRWLNEKRYLAFLLMPAPAGKVLVKIEDIGSASEINGLIAALRESIKDDPQNKRGLGLVRRTGTGKKSASMLDVGQALYKKVLSPFHDNIKKAKVLYISPSGNLNLVPFELFIVPEQGAYLCDSLSIVYALGKDLSIAKIEPKDSPDKKSVRRLYVVAAPDFAATSTSSNTALGMKSAPVVARTLKRGAVRGWPIKFGDLPGTLEEARAIKNVAGSNGATLYLKEKATEEEVKKLKQPGLLHIATHGFFLEDVESRASVSDARGISFIRVIEDGAPINGPAPRGPVELNDPLLRSGLALAGANRLADNIAIAEGTEDGILTASEVTRMDLLGTDLVVLSACNTGLGETQRGEGVLGLRRAFRLAGARNIIMSLWNVPDQETSWLMEEFYKAYFSGDNPVLALNNARSVLRKRLVSRDGIDHPFYWAAFVLEGCLFR